VNNAGVVAEARSFPKKFHSKMTGPVFGIDAFHRWVSEAARQRRIGDPNELRGHCCSSVRTLEVS
jgi:hypothetical protein